ncbi:hypothetical protein NBRC116589_13310 [Ruegeria sp. HU-ET01832]
MDRHINPHLRKQRSCASRKVSTCVETAELQKLPRESSSAFEIAVQTLLRAENHIQEIGL